MSKKKHPQKRIKVEPKTETKKPQKFTKYYILIAVIVTIIFVSIYGFKVLNPTNDRWTVLGADLAQHHIGWEGFRLGSWTFPIGLTDTLSYPMNISVIFTDCIPILAVVFKALSFMLPKSFQYLGLYGLVCYILQGLLAAKIIKKYTDSKPIIVISSLLFVVVPSVIFRMYYHTALASQWLLLLAFETIFLYDEFKEGKKIYYMWALIGFLTASIHLYYLLMCGIILVGYLIYDVLKTKKIIRPILVLATYLITSAVFIYIYGGFTNMAKNDDTGFGNFSYNLNGLINSQGYSVFLKKLPMIPEQYEGFSYLGLGVIILILIATGLIITCRIKDKEYLKKHRKLIISLVIISFISLIFAMSPTAYAGEHLMYNLKLPAFINNLWAVFRSTGRIIWPVIHILTLLSVIVIIKELRPKAAIIILSMCVIFQIIDLGGMLISTHNQYAIGYKISEAYDMYNYESFNKIIENNDIELLVQVGDGFYDSDRMLYADWAVNHNIKTNSFHFARKSFDEMLEANTKELVKEKGSNKMFIFTNEKECKEYGLNCYELPNSNYLGYIKPIE